ncbi:MAG: hypothetical protein RI896_1073 [Pseudomonadota bacterium]
MAMTCPRRAQDVAKQKPGWRREETPDEYPLKLQAQALAPTLAGYPDFPIHERLHRRLFFSA